MIASDQEDDRDHPCVRNLKWRPTLIGTKRWAGVWATPALVLSASLAPTAWRTNTVIRKRIGLLVVLMATMLAGSAGGVAAQSETDAPVSFTGRVQFLGQDCGEGSTFEVVGEIEQMRGFRCDLWMGTSDPRFTGSYVTIGNIDTYRGGEFASPSGPFNVSTFVHRVENDQGAWQGVTTTAYVDPTGEGEDFPLPTETLVFRGEGAYDGLTAVVWRSPWIGNAQVRGVILTGAPPLAPSLPDPAGSD